MLAAERTVNEKYQGALNDAIQKQAALQAAADRVRRERDGLCKQLSEAEQRLADVSPSPSSSTPEPSTAYSDSAASDTRSWQSELMATQLMQQPAAGWPVILQTR